MNSSSGRNMIGNPGFFFPTASPYAPSVAQDSQAAVTCNHNRKGSHETDATSVALAGISSLLTLSPTGALAAHADNGGGSQPFISSAVENPDFTVTLPLQHGTSGGETVYYIVTDTDTDTDDGSLAQQLGINRSNKQRND
jgi:hypothetical protein